MYRTWFGGVVLGAIITALGFWINAGFHHTAHDMSDPESWSLFGILARYVRFIGIAIVGSSMVASIVDLLRGAMTGPDDTVTPGVRYWLAVGIVFGLLVWGSAAYSSYNSYRRDYVFSYMKEKDVAFIRATDGSTVPVMIAGLGFAAISGLGLVGYAGRENARQKRQRAEADQRDEERRVEQIAQQAERRARLEAESLARQREQEEGAARRRGEAERAEQERKAQQARLRRKGR